MSEYSIGEMIKRTRKMRNMKQEDIAFGICSVSTLSRIENGLETPAKTTFDKIIKRLGAPKGLSGCEASGDEAYRLRYLAVRNIIRNPKSQNDDILAEYAATECEDAFVKYVKAVTSFDKQDFVGCIELLDAALTEKKSLGNWPEIDYAIMEPFEIHRLILVAKCLHKTGEYDYAERLIKKLEEYMEGSSCLDGVYGELYILLLAEYADISADRGYPDKSLSICARALKEIERKRKPYYKKAIFDIEAKAYELEGKTDMGNVYRNYAFVLEELINNRKEEKKVAVSMFKC